jgi:hypothetical protein
VQRESDIRKYKGRGHDLLAFDEVPEFTEIQYRTLLAWNRTILRDVRTRVVATGNPPTDQEGQWVLRYWAPWLDGDHPDPARPGELRWFAMIDAKDTEVEGPKPFRHKGETLTPRSRTFIPASLEDNPYLMNTGYQVVLQNLPEPLRSQLLYGDFSIGHDDNVWQVIPTAWIRAAQERWTEEGPDIPISSLGCDPARGGGDRTVISVRYGTWFAPLSKYPGRETDDGPKVAALIATVLAGQNPGVNIDPIGIGSSPLDALQAMGIQAYGVNFASHSSGTDRAGKFRFRNMRAEAYWRFREALDPETGEDLALPPDRELLQELAAGRWKLTISGIQIEAKEEIQERLGRSPDLADAVVLAAMGMGSVGFKGVGGHQGLGRVSPWSKKPEGSRWSTGGSGGRKWGR